MASNYSAVLVSIVELSICLQNTQLINVNSMLKITFILNIIIHCIQSIWYKIILSVFVSIFWEDQWIQGTNQSQWIWFVPADVSAEEGHHHQDQRGPLTWQCDCDSWRECNAGLHHSQHRRQGGELIPHTSETGLEQRVIACCCWKCLWDCLHWIL